MVLHYFHTSEKSHFHFKISGFSAAIKIKLADKSGYQDNGYPDLQTLVLLVLGMGVPVNLLTG